MKILVLSDSHRCIGQMRKAVDLEKPDQILHLGDHESDALRLREAYPEIPLAYVPGNCDHGSDAPQTLTPVIDGVSFLLTHGHQYQVKYSLLRLGLAAQEFGVQAALFGHTHQACAEYFENVLLFNPGAVGSSSGSYGIIETEHGVIKDCRILRLSE